MCDIVIMTGESYEKKDRKNDPSETSLSSGRRVTGVKLLAIIIAGAVVISIGSFVIMDNHTSTPGIPVNLSIHFSGSPPFVLPYVNHNGKLISYYNPENVFFSILSPVPGAINGTSQGFYVNMCDQNITRNPYYISLLNGRLSSDGNYKGILGQNFYNIAMQWRYSGLSNTSKVSVMLQASYSILINGTIYEYRYYNNIQYSPFQSVFNNLNSFLTNQNPQLNSFSSQIYFNLSHPSFVGKVNLSDFKDLHRVIPTLSKTDGQVGPPGGGTGPGPICPYCYNPTVKVVAEKTWTGPLPLTIAEMNLPSSSTLDTSFADFSMVSGISFNTAEACDDFSSSTQVMDSTTGSFSDGSISGLAGSLPTLSIPKSNMSIVYLPDVSFSAVEYRDVYTQIMDDHGNFYCGVIYGNPYTVMSITSMSSQLGENQYLYKLASYSGPNSANITAEDWSAFLNDLGFNKVYTGTLNPGATITAFNYGNYVTEYNTANSAMERANSAVGTVTAVLGVAFAINAVTGIVPGAATGDDVVNELALETSEIGLSSSILSDMSSISVFLSSSAHVNEFTMSNFPNVNSSSGSSVNFSVFQAKGTAPIFFVTPGNYNTYNCNVPMYYFKYVPENQ